MGKSPSSGKKRLNLDLPESVFDKIERVRQFDGSASVSEVIRRALELYGKVVEAQSKGGKIVIRSPDKPDTEVVILF